MPRFVAPRKFALKGVKGTKADMSNTIEGDIDIDFLGVLTLTIDIELVTFE